jgi:hypothetical protein
MRSFWWLSEEEREEKISTKTVHDGRTAIRLVARCSITSGRNSPTMVQVISTIYVDGG